MKHTGLAMLLCLVCFSGSVSANDAARVEAERLLDSLNMQENLDQAIDVMLDVQLKQNPNLVPYKKVMLDFLGKYMSYEALKPELITVYSTEFSTSELAEARAFYSTPTGKKFIARMPALISKNAEIGSKSVQDHLPELEQMLEKEIDRIQKAQQTSGATEDHAISDGTNICWQAKEANENDTVCKNEAAKFDYATCKDQAKEANLETDLESLESSKSFEQCMRDHGWFIKVKRIRF